MPASVKRFTIMQLFYLIVREFIMSSFFNKYTSIIFSSLCGLGLCSTSHAAEVKKRFIPAQEIGTMCEQLFKKINADTFSPDLIIGLSRGGLVPLGYLSGETMFDIRNVVTISVKSYEKSHQSSINLVFPLQKEVIQAANSILVVDDLVDSGKTLSFVMQLLKEQNPDAVIKTATLLYKPKYASFAPDYYVQETDEWIVFPWEQNDVTEVL